MITQCWPRIRPVTSPKWSRHDTLIVIPCGRRDSFTDAFPDDAVDCDRGGMRRDGRDGAHVTSGARVANEPGTVNCVRGPAVALDQVLGHRVEDDEVARLVDGAGARVGS